MAFEKANQRAVGRGLGFAEQGNVGALVERNAPAVVRDAGRATVRSQRMQRKRQLGWL